eukprot:6224573-Karenia_brevis.AAC.1
MAEGCGVEQNDKCRPRPASCLKLIFRSASSHRSCAPRVQHRHSSIRTESTLTHIMTIIIIII